MNSRYVLALDPSGAYKEGKGTTGWCLFDNETKQIAKFGVIKAENYSCQFHYWDAHISLIDSLSGYNPDVVIEDYLLYNNRAEAQTNSRLETRNKSYYIKDTLLVDHIIDSIRHAVHYSTYTSKYRR